MCRQCNEQEPTSKQISFIISLISCKKFCCFESISALLPYFASHFVNFVFEVGVADVGAFLVGQNIHYDYSCRHGFKGDGLLDLEAR
jgi:hypothetical protein